MNSYDGLIPIVLGFVGHRQVSNPEEIQKAIRQLLLEVLEKYPHTPVIVMSALAPGVDQLAVQTALDLKADTSEQAPPDHAERIRIVCPLPLPKELYCRDWKASDQEELDRFINDNRVESFSLPLDEGVKELCEQEGVDDKGCYPPGSQHNSQFAIVGSYISRFSHILVAGWDGEIPDENDPQCGTAFIIKDRLTDIEFSDAYQKTATGVVHEDVLLPPKSRFVNDLEGPVLHLKCARSGSSEAESLRFRWIKSADVSNNRQVYSSDLKEIDYAPIPESFLPAPEHSDPLSGIECAALKQKDELIQIHAVFRQFESFNLGAGKLPADKNPLITEVNEYQYAYKDISMHELKNDPDDESSVPVNELTEAEKVSLIRLKRAFVVADILANLKRDKSFLWAIGILCGALLALLVFIYNDKFHDVPAWVPIIYALLVGGTALVAYLSRKHGAYKEHLDYRFLSEILRVQLAWKVAGLHSSVFWHIPRRYSISRTWMQWALRGLTVFPPSQSDQALSSDRCHYVLRHWITDQLEYYENNKINNSGKGTDLLGRVHINLMLSMMSAK